MDPQGPPRISAGGVSAGKKVQGWGAVAGQPGAPSTLGESPDITRARKDESGGPCQHVSAGKGRRQHERTGRAPRQAPFSKQPPLGVLCCLQAPPPVQAALGLEDVDARLAHGRQRGGRTSDRCHGPIPEPWTGLHGMVCRAVSVFGGRIDIALNHLKVCNSVVLN